MTDPLAFLSGFFHSATADIVGLWVAAILTLLVFSYLLADTFLFRLAAYLLVGVAAGYAVVIAWHGVLAPRLGSFAAAPAQNLRFVAWLLLGLLLLGQRVRALSWFSRIPVAYLFGVGVALAVGGALSGTLIPQVNATTLSLSPEAYGGGRAGLETAIYQGLLVVGTLGALLHFYFTTGTGPDVHPALPAFWVKLARVWGGFGKWMIMIAFGAVLASTVMSRLSLLLGRLQFLFGDWLGLIP